MQLYKHIKVIALSIVLLTTIAKTNAQVVADFNANNTQGCSPVVSNFTDASTGPVVSYLWDFGNGNTSTLQNPKAVFIKPGNYTIKLTVTDGSNNSHSETRINYITVFKSPKAAASTSKKTGCIGETISFNDLSTKGDGNITSWKWDFGDGNLSNQQNPSHSYSNAGTYSIRLIIKDANGCEHSIALPNHIKINPNPDASFKIDDFYNCTAPHKVNFQANKTGLSSYSWTFGDGKYGSGDKTGNTFVNKGNFTVNLEVTDNLGCKNSSTGTVIVNDIIPQITTNKTEACIDEYVNFVGSSSPTLNNVVYDWDLGDGRTVRGPAFSHRYKSEGFYTVKLKVTSGKCIGEKTFNNYIFIREKPKRDITVSDTHSCDPNHIFKLTDNSKDIIKRLWSFSNGSNTSLKSPQINFGSGGIYNYTLEVEDKYKCINTFSGALYVSNVKTNFITSENTSDSIFSIKSNRPVYGKCTPHDIELEENTSSYFKITKVDWDFGDGTSSTAKNIKHTYDLVDSVKHGWLRSEDIYGCKDSIDYYVQLGDSTYPNFTPDKWEICNDDTINFTNLSHDSLNITKVYWDFGKSDYHTFNVFHQKPDSFEVKLTTYHHRCKNDTIIRGFNLIGPFVTISSEYDPCTRDSIFLTAQACEYDSFVWLDEFDNVISHDTIIKILPKSGARYYAKAMSDLDCDQMDSITIALVDVSEISPNWPDIVECAPTEATFDLPPNGLSNPIWIFDNNEISDTMVGFNVKYHFNKAGMYKVKVQAKAAGICTPSKSNLYKVPGIIVKGSVLSKDTCLPFNVTLIDSTFDTKGSNDFFWVINNKDTFRHSAVKSNYYAQSLTRNGKIKFELIGTDGLNCHSSQVYEVLAGGPYADIFSYNQFKCDSIYSDVNLLNKSPNINFISWTIDGKEIGNQNVVVSNFPYNKKNTISVKLADANGCKASYSAEIFALKALNADFSSDTNNSLCPPLEVYFKDKSTYKKPIEKYEWDFGDGTFSYLKDPGKLYLIPGKFTVSLTVTDEDGCISKKVAPEFILVNGPTGSYSFTPDEGCSPLTVDFKSTSQNATIIKWDLGDGKVLNGANQTLTYDRIGQYIPLLILEDKYGCSYTMPPIDTINVRGFPKSDFSTSARCLGEEVNFFNNTDKTNGNISKQFWDFGDGTTDTLETPNHKFPNGKNFIISLISTNEYGCSDTAIQNLKIFDPIANFTPVKREHCLGETIKITNNSSSDTTISNYNWVFEDLETSQLKDPSFPANIVGNFFLQLAIRDDAGCRDTLLLPASIGVGDTTPPAPPIINRASVLNDNAIDITFKSDSISDFLRYELFREISPNNFTKINEMLNQRDSILFDRGVNTLHQSHCFVVNKENFCKVKTDFSKLRKHCTVEATAKGRTNAIDLDWNPYEGWNEVDSYFVYREERTIPDSFTQIGRVNGNTFNFTDTSIYCREELTYKILAKQRTNTIASWSWSDTTKAKPLYENIVPPNEIWRTTVVDDAYTSLEWLPITSNKFPISYYKIQVKQSDGSFKELKEQFDPNLIKFDYSKTEVDDYNYHFQMYGVDVCDDKSVLSIPAKTVLLDVELNEAFRPSLSWTKYEGWVEGVEEYIVEMEDEFGSFTEIGRTAPEDTFLIDEVSPFNCIENYCYRITAVRNQPFNYPDSTHSVISHSNVDCAPVESKIFVPNAFTLNSDGLNEEFTVKGIYIKEYNIKIFNRWGEKVYDSNSFKEHWDGTYKGQIVSQNVMVYLIEAKGVDNKLYHLSGDVTLLK